MMNRDEIVAQLLAECQQDHVGVWELVDSVRFDLGIGEAAAVRAATLDLVERLLQSPDMEIGFPAPDGRHFVPWLISREMAVDIIRHQWEVLGREPSIGEIAWFNRRDDKDDRQRRHNGWANVTLTARQAFLAMHCFLDRYYQMTKADEVGGLLGGLSLLADGSPADPAFQQEWLESVNSVLAAEESGNYQQANLQLRPSRQQ